MATPVQVTTTLTKEALRRSWEQFLRKYKREELNAVALAYPEKTSLEVPYWQLSKHDDDLAEATLKNPEESLHAASQAARSLETPVEEPLDITVRIHSLPDHWRLQVRHLRAEHLGRLIAIRGLVKKSSEVRPKLEVATFACRRCSHKQHVEQDEHLTFKEPTGCPQCEKKTQYRFLESESTFIDTQRLELQEAPEGLRGGEQPERLAAYVEGDLAGGTAAGDRLILNGTLKSDQRRIKGQDSTLFDLFLRVNSIEIQEQEFEEVDISEEEVEEILDFSQDPDLYTKILQSVAPTIQGMTMEKQALGMQLFGGVAKRMPDGSRIRGDIHMLLVGDPGVAKSQLLRFAAKLSPRSVYTSGKSSSAAGLCVTGDTRIHTQNGWRTVRELATPYHPDSVDEDTPATHAEPVYTFNRASGTIQARATSHVWRMPPKECRRVETAHGKTLETSKNTPVLTIGPKGLEWCPLGAIQEGDHVAVPKYGNVDRRDPPITDFLEFTKEKLKLDPASIQRIRGALSSTFGDLRTAADVLGLSEDFIYDTLSNRYVPVQKLGGLLDAVDMNLEELTPERCMLSHGHAFQLPSTFSEELMYLIGLVFGDGDISVEDKRGSVRISNSDPEILERARAIIQDEFDTQVTIEKQEDRVACLRLSKLTLARFFEAIGMRTPKTGLKLDPSLTTARHTDAFLRGLFDADGCVVERENGGEAVQLSTISRDLADQVQFLLETYGIQAKVRERDRRGTYELDDETTIETRNIQHHVEIFGKDIDSFAEEIGFASTRKAAALSRIVGSKKRKDEILPVAQILEAMSIRECGYHHAIARGGNVGRAEATRLLEQTDLGLTAMEIQEIAEADLVWDRVVDVEDTGEKELFDLTVPDTHNFLANGVVVHNTASAVRDELADGRWTLEAGALVLADKGLCAIDEIDKMDQKDQSSMHEGMEQQTISIAKAGITAELRSRCAVLGAANPKFGRFDQNQPMAEQITLEPALMSRFDVIFTLTDRPEEQSDAELAEHIMGVHRAGAIREYRAKHEDGLFTEEDQTEANRVVDPPVDESFLRKYIAYAKRECYPVLTDDARRRLQEYYVDVRKDAGGDEGGRVPMTPRQLEALVRLTEASARMRLSNRAQVEDAKRAIDVMKYWIQQLSGGSGLMDIDLVASGVGSSQRERIRLLMDVIEELCEENPEGAPRDEVVARMGEQGITEHQVEDTIRMLKNQRGTIYSPDGEHFRLVR